MNQELIREINLNRLDNFLKNEKINELNCDFEKVLYTTSYSNPLTLHGQFLNLNEGLIHTYPIDKTIEYIKKRFNLGDRQISKSKMENGVEQILVIFPCVNNNEKMLIKAFNLCGYHLSYPKLDNIVKNNWMILQFEPKFQDDISQTIKKTEKYLLHITPKYNLKKILNIGLSPKTKNNLFDYPNRIYLLKGSTPPNEIMFLINKLHEANQNEFNDGEYALILLNINELSDNISLFLDSNFENGLFTTDYIKPNAIYNVEIININQIKKCLKL
jgi:hypothetical protein